MHASYDFRPNTPKGQDCFKEPVSIPSSSIRMCGQPPVHQKPKTCPPLTSPNDVAVYKNTLIKRYARQHSVAYHLKFLIRPFFYERISHPHRSHPVLLFLPFVVLAFRGLPCQPHEFRRGGRFCFCFPKPNRRKLRFKLRSGTLLL